MGAHRHDEAEKRLPKASLVLLSKFEPVLQWTKHCDNVLYQGLVEILIPDVLRPIPSERTPPSPPAPPRPPGPDQPPLPPTGALTQAIRNFAKSLESWLTHAMVNIPEEMLRVKVRLGAGASGPSARGCKICPYACPLRLSSGCCLYKLASSGPHFCNRTPWWYFCMQHSVLKPSKPCADFR